MNQFLLSGNWESFSVFTVMPIKDLLKLQSSERSKIYLIVQFIDFQKLNTFYCYFWLCIYVLPLESDLASMSLVYLFIKCYDLTFSCYIITLKEDFVDFCRALETFGCVVLRQDSQSPTAPL